MLVIGAWDCVGTCTLVGFHLSAVASYLIHFMFKVMFGLSSSSQVLAICFAVDLRACERAAEDGHLLARIEQRNHERYR